MSIEIMHMHARGVFLKLHMFAETQSKLQLLKNIGKYAEERYFNLLTSTNISHENIEIKSDLDRRSVKIHIHVFVSLK